MADRCDPLPDLGARLAGWITAQGIKGRYPAEVLAAHLVRELGAEYVTGRLDSGDTAFLRGAAERHVEEADMTLQEWAAENHWHGHLAEDMRP